MHFAYLDMRFVFPCLCLCSCQTFERSTDDRVQPRASGFEMRKNCRAHPWIPEFSNVIRRPRSSLFPSLTRKELADLIGHVN